MCSAAGSRWFVKMSLPRPPRTSAAVAPCATRGAAPAGPPRTSATRVSGTGWPPPHAAPHSRSTNSCKRWALPMVPYIQHIVALLAAELAVDAWRSVMSANQHELMLLSLQELVPCCRGCRCRCHRCLGLAPVRRLPRGACPRWDYTLARSSVPFGMMSWWPSAHAVYRQPRALPGLVGLVVCRLRSNGRRQSAYAPQAVPRSVPSLLNTTPSSHKIVNIKTGMGACLCGCVDDALSVASGRYPCSRTGALEQLDGLYIQMPSSASAVSPFLGKAW